LVVGATGKLGGLIVNHLLEYPNLSVRILVRPKTFEEKKDIMEGLKRQGIEIFVGEVEGEPLNKALEGVHTVISAVIGGPEVILDAQRRLLQAAESAGVKRIVPSDFSFDMSRLDDGDNFFSDLRRTFAKDVANTKLKSLSIGNGFFYETAFLQFSHLFDFKDNSINYYGDGEAKVNWTSYDDTARFTAAAVANPELEGVLRFAADTVTFNEFANAYERATGKKLTRYSLGPVQDLKNQVKEAWVKYHNPFAVLPDGRFVIAGQYHWPIAEGKTSFKTLDNDRFPEIKPEKAEDWIRRNKDQLGQFENEITTIGTQ